MWAMNKKVADPFTNQEIEMSFSDYQKPPQTFLAEAQNPSLDESVQIGTSWWQWPDFDARSFERGIEVALILAVAIPSQFQLLQIMSFSSSMFQKLLGLLRPVQILGRRPAKRLGS
jgi:hypothetical protein